MLGNEYFDILELNMHKVCLQIGMLLLPPPVFEFTFLEILCFTAIQKLEFKPFVCAPLENYDYYFRLYYLNSISVHTTRWESSQ